MMTQKEAVFSAVADVKGSKEFGEKVVLSKEERIQAAQRIFKGFKSGDVQFGSDLPSDEKLMGYISGLISNWLRKDTRLNGGTNYVAKNPGSRAGSGDESLKAMRDLLKVTTDPEAKAEIQKHIEARVQELKPRKSINVQALPASLRHLAQTH